MLKKLIEPDWTLAVYLMILLHLTCVTCIIVVVKLLLRILSIF